MRRPRVFIGSSSEGLTVAEALFTCLKRSSEPTLWTHDLFRPGRYPLEELEVQLKKHAFAILVASPDDEIFKRGDRAPAMRDNLLVEFGMFAGALGRRRAFFVCPDKPTLSLPSDLAGIINAGYDAERAQRGASETAAAVQVACQQIRSVIEEEWATLQQDRKKQQLRLRSSEHGKALERLHSVAIHLRDALIAVQRDSFSALSDESVFREIRQSAAEHVGEIASSFQQDAETVGVETQLASLAKRTIDAVLDLPFPKELSVGRDVARRRAFDIGAGALSDFLSGGDPLSRISSAASSEADGRVEGLRHRYTEWWDKHSPGLEEATRSIQDALFTAAIALASEGQVP